MRFESHHNPTEEYEIVRKEVQRLVKTVSGINSIKPKDPGFINKLEKYGNNLPKGDELKQTIDTIKERIDECVAYAKSNRLSEFGKYFNQFIGSLQQKGIPHRVTDNAYVRVEALEIQANYQKGQIRVLFNKSTLLPWQDIYSAADIETMHREAKDMLDKSVIPEQILPDIIVSAYRTVRMVQEVQKKSNAHFVPLQSLHREMIVELLRQQMKGKSGLDKKFKEIYLPEWAFRYNLDRYRSVLINLPEEKKLIFQTGSQAETEKSGVVLNGLNPQQEYKKFCFVEGSGR